MSGHLAPDAPHQRCNRCGRLTWSPAQFDSTCQMTQPDGRACLGLFEWVGTGPGQTSADNARLSKLLFTAREAIEMLADIVSARTHQNPLHLRELVCEIDNYRADRGWSPHGFGGET